MERSSVDGVKGEDVDEMITYSKIIPPLNVQLSPPVIIVLKASFIT